MTRAARYRRISGETQLDNTSLEEQLKEINKYCLMKGYTFSPEHLYTDVMTGIEQAWRDRYDLQRMLAASKRNEFDVVVIHHTDRLARGEPLIIIMEELFCIFSLCPPKPSGSALSNELQTADAQQQRKTKSWDQLRPMGTPGIKTIPGMS